MRKICIDENFKCHVQSDTAMIEVETDFFDSKCKEFIEGYRFIPTGQSWTREDGIVFTGEMVSPWKPYEELEAAQWEYERQQLVEAQTALGIIFGEVEV